MNTNICTPWAYICYKGFLVAFFAGGGRVGGVFYRKEFGISKIFGFLFYRDVASEQF